MGSRRGISKLFTRTRANYQNRWTYTRLALHYFISHLLGGGWGSTKGKSHLEGAYRSRRGKIVYGCTYTRQLHIYMSEGSLKGHFALLGPYLALLHFGFKMLFCNCWRADCGDGICWPRREVPWLAFLVMCVLSKPSRDLRSRYPDPFILILVINILSSLRSSFLLKLRMILKGPKIAEESEAWRGIFGAEELSGPLKGLRRTFRRAVSTFVRISVQIVVFSRDLAISRNGLLGVWQGFMWGDGCIYMCARLA